MSRKLARQIAKAQAPKQLSPRDNEIVHIKAAVYDRSAEIQRLKGEIDQLNARLMQLTGGPPEPAPAAEQNPKP